LVETAGNASQLIDELVAKAIAGNLKSADQPRDRRTDLRNEELKATLNCKIAKGIRTAPRLPSHSR